MIEVEQSAEPLAPDNGASAVIGRRSVADTLMVSLGVVVLPAVLSLLAALARLLARRASTVAVTFCVLASMLVTRPLPARPGMLLDSASPARGSSRAGQPIARERSELLTALCERRAATTSLHVRAARRASTRLGEVGGPQAPAPIADFITPESERRGPTGGGIPATAIGVLAGDKRAVGDAVTGTTAFATETALTWGAGKVASTAIKTVGALARAESVVAAAETDAAAAGQVERSAARASAPVGATRPLITQEAVAGRVEAALEAGAPGKSAAAAAPSGRAAAAWEDVTKAYARAEERTAARAATSRGANAVAKVEGAAARADQSFDNPFGTNQSFYRSQGINPLKTAVLRGSMASSEIGRKVLAAADDGIIGLELSGARVERGLLGESTGFTGTAYIRNTQSYARTAETLIHEGVHSLGVRGSRRAELYARMAEAMHRGEMINGSWARRTYKDFLNIDGYKALPWTAGRTSPHFPGLKF